MYRPVAYSSNDISATFELRAGVVKAEARRVERSESLDDVEHSSTLIMWMADAKKYGDKKPRRKHSAFGARSATNAQRTTHSRTTRRSLAVSMAVCDTGTGA